MRTWLRGFLVAFGLVAISGTALAQFQLTLNFQNMNPHLNQAFQLRVVNKTSGLEVGRHVIGALSDANFTIEMLVLLDGESYWIDFFADLNQNGQYDAPPADHAWRMELNNAASDTALTFSHNTSFTDIQWPGDIDPYQFTGEWSGTWKNLTFQTTGPISGTITFDTDSMKVSGEFKTTGAFGNPDTTVFAFEGKIDSTSGDTMKVQLPAPWTGSVALFNGTISGTITDPYLFGTGLSMTFTGNFGLAQAIYRYKMSGTFQADGIVIMSHPDIPTGIVSPVAASKPEDFAILQNYPNPFNPETRIRLQLKSQAQVVVSIYDVRGRLVRQYAPGAVQAGVYEITWDARDSRGLPVPGGMYLAKVTIAPASQPAITQTLKMLLLK